MVDSLKFKRLIQTDWFNDKEANFVLFLLNKLEDLGLVYIELGKMSNRGSDSDSFILVPEHNIDDHYTMSNRILTIIDDVELTEDNIKILRNIDA